MVNEIKLQEGHPIDENLRPLKIGGELSGLELSNIDAKIRGDLYVGGEIKGKTDITIGDDIICDDITCDDLVVDQIIGAPIIVATTNDSLSIAHITDEVGPATYSGISVASSKTGTGGDASGNTLHGGKFSTYYTEGTNGLNQSYGVYAEAYLTHSANAGIPKVWGGYFKATGSTNGSSEARGLETYVAALSDTTYGLIIKTPDGATADIYIPSSADSGDYFALRTAGNGATTITTVDDDNADADLTFTIDGDTIIDRNVDLTDAGTYTGLSIDFDKTGTSTSNNTLHGLLIDVDNTTATNGTNYAYGIYSTTTMTHAADAGNAQAYGGYLKATGGTNGSGTTYGLKVIAESGDINYGIIVDCENGGTDFSLLSSASASDWCRMTVTANGVTKIITNDNDGEVGHLTLDVDGDINFDSKTGINYYKYNGDNYAKLYTGGLVLNEAAGQEDDWFRIATTTHGATTLTTHDDAAEAGHLTLNIDGDIILDPHTGNFIAKNAGTEFSPASCSYAGMILGYTHLTTTGGAETFTVPTSASSDIAIIDADAKVTFKAPPSGNVEIEFSVYRDSSTINETIFFGISDDAGSWSQVSAEIGDGSTSYELITQFGGFTADETDDFYLTMKFPACGLTPNTEYEWWIGVYGTAGTTYLRWGGTTTTSPDRMYPPFVIKATALPTDAVIHTQ